MRYPKTPPLFYDPYSEPLSLRHNFTTFSSQPSTCESITTNSGTDKQFIHSKFPCIPFRFSIPVSVTFDRYFLSHQIPLVIEVFYWAKYGPPTASTIATDFGVRDPTPESSLLQDYTHRDRGDDTGVRMEAEERGRGSTQVLRCFQVASARQTAWCVPREHIARKVNVI